MQSTGLLAKVNKTGIRQVLINLVSNAIKYSRSSGNIWISFGLFENCVKLTIKDEGCGIRQEEIPLIFNKFYRAAGSELEKGSGLGLYIVKLLTESMGGTVTAVSEQNTGSAFTVSFPIARSVAAPSMAQETV
jgi:signal transduction histidine kinase